MGGAKAVFSYEISSWMKTALLNEAFLLYTIPPNETDFLRSVGTKKPLWPTICETPFSRAIGVPL
ncbi:hypothetical protein SLEP1_g59162 [Rubroshorea leprosula]|uniref:Uncharacterized protein n=1 Tax=Rubroshorea leprosula TaxID=152421 RepID=A0AAV5MV42_9ROSI|nr:hypothetical protein SLEP1_g59162 [Rubroshorea leprosula]